jgi:cytochrome c oxidase assembly protein subunit 11
MPAELDPKVRRRNRIIMTSLCSVAFGMGVLAFASSPLYRMFCQVTGYGGTTQVADSVSGQVLDRKVKVRFVANTDADLPWSFKAEQTEVEVKLGEPALIYFQATNNAKEPTAGQAVYNVTPDKVGLYFSKVQCFCFTEQIIQPGETVEFPVYFYVDAAMDAQPNLKDVQTITLSYTFYSQRSKSLENAVAAYYRAAQNNG